MRKSGPSYEEFKKDFLKRSCGACPFSGQRIVFDRGNPKAKVMIVGEAPGAAEDKAGVCFVGRAGKMLDRIMASIGLDTNRDTLIVNVMKCRPPGNRVPSKNEVDSCLPILWEQIERVDPAILILLGRTALKHVIPDRPEIPMEKEVGVVSFFVHQGRKIPYMALYHPAYLLYDPRKVEAMMRHVKVLQKFLKGIPCHPEGFVLN